MRISKLLKLLLAASMPLYATDEDEAGNVSAVPAATSAESLPESTNNPTTEDTNPTTDTPLASSSSPSADSQSDSSSAGSSVLSSGSAPVNATEVQSKAAEDAALGEDTAASDAANQSENDTASSASNALPVEGTADTAADSSLLAAGKADAAVIPAPVVASTSGGVVGGMLPVAPLPVVDSGNVQAAGALDADGTGSQTDDEDRHPAVPHLRALRNKIESGEAIIMADLLAFLHRIEESL